MIKKILAGVSFSLVLFVMSLDVMAYENPIQSIIDCTKINDDNARLDCFDTNTKKLIPSEKSVSNAYKDEPTKIDKEGKIDAFGQSHLKSSPIQAVREEQKKQDQELTNITLKVVKYSYTAYNKFVLYMENGQIWKQKDKVKARLPKGEFEVEIRKNAFNGFNMFLPTKKAMIRVERLK